MVLSPQRSPRAHISTVFTTRMILLIFVKKWLDQHIPSGRGEVMMRWEGKENWKSDQNIDRICRFPHQIEATHSTSGPLPGGGVRTRFFSQKYESGYRETIMRGGNDFLRCTLSRRLEETPDMYIFLESWDHALSRKYHFAHAISTLDRSTGHKRPKSILFQCTSS